MSRSRLALQAHAPRLLLATLWLSLLQCGSPPQEALSPWEPPVPALDGTSPWLQAQVESALEGNSDWDRADRVGALADLYHASGFHDEAAQCYARAAAVEPSEPRWRYLEALAHLAEAHIGAARKRLEEVLRLDPSYTPARVRLARIAIEQGELAEARGQLDAARETAPEDPAVASELGRLSELSGDAESAVRWLESALEKAPSASALHYRLGQLLRRLGRDEEASFHLSLAGQKKVELRDPWAQEVAERRVTSAFASLHDLVTADDLPDRELVGFAIAQFGHVRAATQRYQTSLSKAPLNEPRHRARAELVLGALHAHQGRHREALKAFDRALDWDSTFRPAAVRRAIALGRTGDSAGAVSALRQLLEERPDSDTGLALAELLLGQGEPRHALEVLEGPADDEAQRPEALTAMGRAWSALGESERAEEALRSALQGTLSPDLRGRTLAHLANLAEHNQNREGALGLYRQAVAADPDSADLHRILGAALGRAARYAEAASAYRAAVQLRGEDVDARLGEATALLLAKQWRAAAYRLEEAVNRHSDDLRFRGMLARHLAGCPDRSARNGGRALELARHLVAEQPSLSNRETLAMAWAEVGDLTQAEQLQQELVTDATTRGATEDLPRLRANLERYRAGESCCATLSSPASRGP